jgi:UV excision repair protein RAD23
MDAFKAIREMLRTDPSAIKSIIRNFEQTEPDNLGRQYRQHPEELIEWMGIDPTPFDFDAIRNERPVNRANVTLTDDDRQAIKRLVALGFPEERVIPIYLAAGRNETVAANMLLGV